MEVNDGRMARICGRQRWRLADYLASLVALAMLEGASTKRTRHTTGVGPNSTRKFCDNSEGRACKACGHEIKGRIAPLREGNVVRKKGGHRMTNESVLVEIDAVLKEYKAAEELHGFANWGSDSLLEFSRMTALLGAAIVRVSPPRSAYPSQAEAVIKREAAKGGSDVIRCLAGILQAIRSDYDADRIRTFQELVHSDLFADILEAAEYLLGESYKDPAAVMAGGVLEQHLRELCRKLGVDTTFVNGKGETKPKMLDAMNADLAKAGAYGKIEQKEVTAWVGIRNAAAHGEYDKYDDRQVGQMVAGIRSFISKYPA
jgi:hypothetical protein